MPENKMSKADASRYEKLLELDKEFLEFYIKQAPVELEKLKNAYDCNDLTEVKFQAHKMIPTMLMIKNEKAAAILRTISKQDEDEPSASIMTKLAIKEIESALSNIN